MIKPQTLKGFRDFLPLEARKRQYVIAKLKAAFERFGFEPLETPVLEYEEILTGKYGEEGEKLMYRFEDHGKRRVAMRYDQTVPLARVIAQYQNEIAFPFKRYQIQPVWRAENTQRGRFREFLQCDADIVGSSSLLADTEVIATAVNALESLGIKNYKVYLNHRETFSRLPQLIERPLTKEEIDLVIRIIDKKDKIQDEGVIRELQENGFTEDKAKHILTTLNGLKPLNKITEVGLYLEKMGISQYEYQPHLARGLNYYTGIIFEIKINEYTAGSVCGGGRYDNLIGMFSNKSIPAVGFALGFDRTIEAMNTLNLFPAELAQSATQVLVTIFSEEFKQQSLTLCSRLRSNNINAEIYLGEIKQNNPLEKQLKFADKKGIPYALILGPEEAGQNIVTLKNLRTREQTKISVDEILEKI